MLFSSCRIQSIARHFLLVEYLVEFFRGRGSEITRISLHRKEYLIALADVGLQEHGMVQHRNSGSIFVVRLSIHSFSRSYHQYLVISQKLRFLCRGSDESHHDENDNWDNMGHGQLAMHTQLQSNKTTRPLKLNLGMYQSFLPLGT